VIFSGVAVKSIVILGGISYVGGQAMGMSAADVAAQVIGGGSAATVHMVRQTGAELKAAQAQDPTAKTDKKGN
jgi:hypothetical protein